MTVECVTTSTNHLFEGNPIAQQHMLRYHAIIQRQQWPVPEFEGMEYDTYDNPATVYLIYRDSQGIARGVSRFCPTDRPFMLNEVFAHTVQYQDMPQGKEVLEASRFCVDHELDGTTRRRICQELIIAYLEYGLAHNIKHMIGIMYPAYWNSLFTKLGWDPEWLGDVVTTPDGKTSRAGMVHVSEEALANVRQITGIHQPVISYGDTTAIPAVAA